MSLQNTLLLIYTVATVIQVFVVAVSVVFIYWQARETRRSVENIERSSRLETYLRHRHDVQDINRLLLANDELSGLLGYDKQEFLAFVFLGHAETMFRFKQEEAMGDEVWISMRRLMEKISKMQFVAYLWPQVKDEYTRDFVEYFDGLIAGNPQ